MRHSYRIREVEPDALSTAATVSVKMGLWQAETPMCGARATPTISVKLNLGGQCRGYRIREVGSVAGGDP
ncbi:hypothetical protein D3C72_2314890 [compost metagenome]